MFVTIYDLFKGMMKNVLILPIVVLINLFMKLVSQHYISILRTPTFFDKILIIKSPQHDR